MSRFEPDIATPAHYFAVDAVDNLRIRGDDLKSEPLVADFGSVKSEVLQPVLPFRTSQSDSQRIFRRRVETEKQLVGRESWWLAVDRYARAAGVQLHFDSCV